MDVSRNKSRIVVTCLNRLMPWVKQEITALGFGINGTFATGLELHGTINDCIRLNLNLRCASNVLYLLRDFTARNPEEVYRQVKSFPWEVVIQPDGYFSVTSHVQHPTVNNNMFVNMKVKDAIADRFREQTGVRPNSGAGLNGVVVHLFWKENQASLFLDTTGPSLARHGYRKKPGAAPMLEALAAAAIMAGKWDKKTPFVNPMCGSGTLAIEAALLATNRKPGLLRQAYAFQHVIGYDAAFYQEQMEQLKQQVITQCPPIIATDLRPEAVADAQYNARLAAVDHLIDFKVCDFRETPVPGGEKGVVFFNPGYGERMGELAELEKVYSRIGDFMKNNCKGYIGYVFTGNPELAKKIGLKSAQKIKFYSAQLDCLLLEYPLY